MAGIDASPDPGTAVIIGTGPGLGLSLASELGQRGYHIGLVAHSVDVLSDQAAVLRAAGVGHHTVHADVRDLNRVTAAIDSCEETLGPATVVVANTSRMVLAPPTRITMDDFTSTMEIVCFSAVAALRHVGKGMIERGRGSFIVPMTPLAHSPWPAGCSLGAAKAALNNFVANAFADYRHDGVYVGSALIDGQIGSSDDYAPEELARFVADVAELPDAQRAAEVTYSEFRS